MQKDLDQSFPELDIQILGMNPARLEIGNGPTTEGRDIPWLQDIDANDDGDSDNWLNSWPFEYRDVVIVDANNVAVDAYNLTINSLAEPNSYATLRQMLIDVAQRTIQPADDVVHVDVDSSVDVNILANDGGQSRLSVTSLTQPSYGTVELLEMEYPADLDPIETFMPDLLISEIVPGSYVELYNARYTEIDLSGVDHVLVSGSDSVEIADLGQGQVIPKRGYLQLPWPSPISVSSASGEMILFRDRSTGFDDASKIDDFVAWGEVGSESRIDLARLVGKWEGPPDGSLDLAAIQRIPGTRGEEAHAYDNHRPSTPGTAIFGATETQQVARYTPQAGFMGVDTFTYFVEDDQGATGSASVELRVESNAYVWQNPTNALDVNNDGQVTELDALAVFARLDAGFTGWLPDTTVWPLTPPEFVDCNGSQSIEPLDALLVINYLTAITSSSTGSGVAAAPTEGSSEVTELENTDRQWVEAAMARLVEWPEEQKLRFPRFDASSFGV